MALTVPNTFVAGTTAVASEVNDNFVAVKTFVDGLETDVTALETDVAALEIKSPVITLAGDLTGSATLTNLGNATLTATIAANSVALGTDTTGNYVSNVTAGTGVTVTHTPGEGSSAAVAIDSSVVTLSGTQTLTNKTLTSPTITGVSPVVTLSGDVTGSATLTNLGSATISATIAANSVALGTDTTGDYVSTISAGTGITGSASGESSTPTIAIDTAVVPQLASANTFTTNQIISGSSASALLRITQTGSGNALVVEDSTNPDSTPLVVDAAGRLIVGHTQNIAIGGLNPLLQVHTGVVNSSMTRWVGTASGAELRMAKSRSATIGSFSAVSSADVLATINGYGDDGTSFVLGGSIAIRADAAVSTGVVPGRLEFSTASSSGTLTERMCINSAGEVGIGGTPSAGRTLNILKNLTGSTATRAIAINASIQSDSTSTAHGVHTFIGTAASAFTVGALRHFFCEQTTIGASSAITDQIGYAVGSSLTGATNNYGFRGQIASGTNRWNLYMDGTAANYMAGRLGIGAALTSGAMAQVTNTTAADKAFVVKGAASQSGLLLDVQNSAGTSLVVVDSAGYVGIGTSSPYQPASYGALTVNGTGGSIYSGRVNGTEHFRIQSTSSSTSINLIANLPLLFNTNNTERMRIDSSGQVGIGGTPSARVLGVAKSITGGTAAFGVVVNGAIQSDVTGAVQVYRSGVSTAAASFTLTSLTNFYVAGISTPGSGSAITNQYGYFVDSSLTGAGNNYGFYGDIAAGTGRYNLYMGGTAANYMAGRLGVGATLTSGAMAQVTNTTAADKAFVVKGAASQTGLLLDVQNSAGTSLAVIDSAGRLVVNSATAVAAVSGVTPVMQVLGAAAASSSATINRYSADTNGPAVYLGKSRNATVGSHTVATSGDRLGNLYFSGSDGTNFVLASSVAGEADGSPSSGIVPGRLLLFTANSSGTMTERMRIDSAGNLLVGMTAIATSSAKTIHLANATVPTANPTGGGVLYVESGALKYRGSSGTVTTLGNA